jgi:hypothetical protein
MADSESLNFDQRILRALYFLTRGAEGPALEPSEASHVAEPGLDDDPPSIEALENFDVRVRGRLPRP